MATLDPMVHYSGSHVDESFKSVNRLGFFTQSAVVTLKSLQRFKAYFTHHNIELHKMLRLVMLKHSMPNYNETMCML